MSDEQLNKLSERIIGCAMDVHRELGPGLLESVYEECLALALKDAGFDCERQGQVAVVFRGRTLEHGFRFDLRVNGLIIIEVKAIDMILPIHKAQVINYLHLTGCPLGLLMNFHALLLKSGLHRLVNPSRLSSLTFSAPPRTPVP